VPAFPLFYSHPARCSMAKRELFRAHHELFPSREPTVKRTVHVYSHVPVSSLNQHKNKNCSPARRRATGGERRRYGPFRVERSYDGAPWVP
jgi:hypothetical protein